MSLYTRASAALAALVPGGVAGAARAFVAPGAGPAGRSDGWATGPRGRRDGVPFDPEAYGSWAGGGNGSNVVVNFLNGLGLSGDMSTGIRFLRPRRLQWTELDALHTDAIGRRIAELPAHEATREGYQVRPLRAKDAAFAQRVVDRLTARAGDLELLSRLFEARWRRRTFGSCLIVIGTEDCFTRDATSMVTSSDFSKPLRTGAEVLWLRCFDARWYRIAETYGEGHPLCGQPRMYEVRGWDRPNLEADYSMGARMPTTSYTRLVHASRVWRDAEPEGWSIFDGLARDLARLLSSAKGAEDALTGMAVPVFEIDGLTEKLQRDEKGVRDHIHAVNAAKSMVNALIIEKGEEKFEWQKLTLAGVSDVINSLSLILSAATGIPMTLLFGMSPGGFSGGDSEERNWHNYIRSVQRELGHGVAFVLRLLLGEMGVPVDAFDFAVDWNKLLVLTDLEAVELRDKASQYWGRIIERGIVKASEVRASAYGSEGFSYDVAIDATVHEEVQANLGATEATAVLELLKAYYDPASTMPREAAIYYLIAVDPSLKDIAPMMIRARPAGTAVPFATAASSPAGGALLGAGATAPAEDAPVVPERPPDVTNTWRTADEIAALLACAASYVKRLAREGRVAVRPRTGKRGATLYAQEHVIEALAGTEVPRHGEQTLEAVESPSPATGDAATEGT